MISCLKKIGTVFIVLSLATSLLMAQDKSDIRELYQQAKMKSFSREWNAAITLFEELLDKYPDSKYEDDAKFWIGYCLERLPDQRQEAFRVYSELVNEHPNSTWVDDALVRQIELAEQFVAEGRVAYKEYLYDQMAKETADVQYRAAVALGRIGDKKALPVLQKMQNDEDYGDLAADLITVLQADRMPVEEDRVKQNIDEDFSVTFEGEDPGLEDVKVDILWFNTKKYTQYRSMLRKDDNWSKEELTDFALWHILETDEFEEYSFLTTAYDKSEWRRKYWKRKDPTPTTSENEYEQEFQKRIDYARENFAGFWNYTSFRYMPDQHLRLGWPHAPWDARGELYIKYGEPDTRSEQGWHREEWAYYEHSVDFLVRKFVTNIYGNAIHAGEISIRMYSVYGDRFDSFRHLNPLSSRAHMKASSWTNASSYLQANFIYNNEMRYEFDYEANPIKGMQIEIAKMFDQDKGKVTFKYKLPVDQFTLLKANTGLEARYKEVYCVLDEDMREVIKNEMIRRIGNIPDEEFTLEENILVNLPSGNYTLYLRIEDQNGSNLGIYSQNFEVNAM